MAANEDIARRIRKTLVQALSLEIDEAELTGADRIDDLIALDSIAALEFVVALEEEFGIVIESDRLEMGFLGDIGRLAAYIEAALLRPAHG